MRVRRAECIVYGGRVEGVRGATVRYASRQGVLLRLLSVDGIVAQGEASPLPGYSPERFEDALTALTNVDWSMVPEHDAGEPVLAYLDCVMSATSGLPPSARFAVEAALLDTLAQREKRPLWSLFTENPGYQPGVPLSALVGGADDPSVVEASLAATERGFATIKVKIAGPVLSTQLETLAAVRQAIGARALRLDANQSLAPSTAEAELAALVGLNPEVVEEPVSLEVLYGSFFAPRFTSPVPIALDESLQEPRTLARLAPEFARLRCVAVVLKPMVLGGFGACARLAAEASSAGLDVTVSHLFDGPVALAASAHLALVVGSRTRASGLARHGGLAGWPGVFAGPEPTTLVAGALPGLGVPPLEAPA